MALSVTPAQHKPRRSSDILTWWISLYVLCAVLGALLGLSLKAHNDVIKMRAPSNNFEGLLQVYMMLKKTVNDLNGENASLKKHIKVMEGSLKTGTAAKEEIKRYKAMAGLTELSGPGVIITLNDSNQHMPSNTPSFLKAADIVHDSDINNVVSELKAAGAEAISVNGKRLGILSTARCAGPTIYLNEDMIVPPFVIQAIGAPDVLEPALKIEGGIYDQLSQLNPNMIKIQRVNKVVIPAYKGVTEYKLAQPVTTKDNG